MSGTEAPVGPLEPFQGPYPTGSPQPGANAKEDGGGHRDKWKQDCGPGHQKGYKSSNEGRKRGADGVHEPEPTAHKIARQNEANGTRSKADE
jgi:hypothetical protein